LKWILTNIIRVNNNKRTNKMNTQVLKLQEKVNTTYYNNKNNLQPRYYVKLPINKLRGLVVTCNLTFNKNYHVQLEIESDNVYTLDNDGNTNFKRLYLTTLLWNDKPLEEDDYKTILEKLSETMKKIKFNKYTGFYETEISNDLSPDDWCLILGNEDYIEYTFDKCCVCHEMTKTITENCCKKQLCYECWDKMPLEHCENCEEDSGCDCEYAGSCGTSKCPLCRCSLASGKEFES